MRFAGACEWIADRNVTDLTAWIESIDLAEWHQQSPIDHQLRPAMMTDLNWHGFGARVKPLMQELSATFQWPKLYQAMLSVVMPGHNIPPHIDEQNPNWWFRVHVPLLTNPESDFIVEDTAHQLHVGGVYKVNTQRVHAVTNRGPTPRYHFMFDVGD